MRKTIISALFLVISAGIFSASLIYLSEKQKPRSPITKQNTSSQMQRTISLQQPLEISEEASDIERCNSARQHISSDVYETARWGYAVFSLTRGLVICEEAMEALFYPASIQKLVTASVSLDMLGADFRSKTQVFSAEAPIDGVIQGDLILYGGGAPDLTSKQIEKLAIDLQIRGIREIKGDVIGDESYFKGDGYGDGWTWNELQWYYGARASALSFDSNLAKVSISPREISSDSSYVNIDGYVEKVVDVEAFGVKRKAGTNNIYVWGNTNQSNVRIAIENPAYVAARILKEALVANGITIGGEARTINWMNEDRIDPENAHLLKVIESEQLRYTIRKMNKDSVNLYAELIIRELGKRFGDQAPDDNPMINRLRGDDLAGASVIQKWLEDRGIARNNQAIHDGSGLSRLDLVSPETFLRLLIYQANQREQSDFIDSLPISGVDGTLNRRLSGKDIIAKTGSIQYVNSLAGYANFEDSNERRAFVIIGNNLTEAGESSKAIDDFIGEFSNSK